MSNNTNKYIEELLRYLSFSLETEERWEKAVRALVAERDAVIKERDALKQRVAELEAASKPRYIVGGGRVESIDLRERLVCAALTGMLANPSFDHEAETIVHWGLKYSDELIAAMRKEGGDA